MKYLETTCILIVLMAVPCLGIQGYDVSLNKANENTASVDSTSPPVYQINYQTISESRDPIQYEAPTRKFVMSESDNNTDESNTDESLTNSSGNVFFMMIGNINGTGRFNNWRAIDAIGKSRIRQSSSVTRGGHASREDIVSFMNQNTGDNLNVSIIALQDHVDFDGKTEGSSYLEWGNYNNMGDSISNYFDTRTILKDSVYIAKTYRNLTQDERYYPMANLTAIWRSTKYNLDTGFTGNYGIEQKSDNMSTMSERYNGGFVVHTKISNNVSFNLTGEVDHWLPCCQYESNNI